MGEPIQHGTSTPAQRRAIVLAGRQRGMDLDQLRGMTPAGSLRALSFDQAAAILDRLHDGRPAPERKRRPPRRSRPGILKMVTLRQRETIASLQVRIGWGDERLDEFLWRTFGLRMQTLASRRDASRIITILGRVLEHKQGKCSRSGDQAGSLTAPPEPPRCAG